jgi:ABC-type uncharacterized transport system involved in gliding motility auxiliary subunit
MKHTAKQTYYVFAVFAFILITYLIQNLPLRLDLSKNRAYTLSDSTEKILTTIKDPVTITFYSSRQLPSRLQPAKREVADLLSEYKRVGKNKITVVTKDPKQSEQGKKEAESNGVPELNFSQQEQDQFAVTTGYFGIGISNKTQRAAIPQVANIEDLEYNLTSAIYKISSTQLPSIGLIGGDSPEQQFNMLRQVAASQFQLTDAATPAGNLKTILVIDNRQKKYSDTEVADFEKYIKNGGKAIFFVDGVWIDQTLQSSKADHNLFGLFKKFGVTLNENLILSRAAEVINFGGGPNGMNILTAYPYWFRTQSFNREVSYLSNVRQINFPWASSLTLATPKGIQLNTLVQTPTSSWEQKRDFTLRPQDIKKSADKDLRQFTQIVTASMTNGGELMVIPSSRFIEDQFLSRASGNLEFVLNVMNDYAAGGALSGIRHRAIDLYPLPTDLSNHEKDAFKYLTIMLLPALFAGYGIFRLIKRK